MAMKDNIGLPRGVVSEIARRYGCSRWMVIKEINRGNEGMMIAAQSVLEERRKREAAKQKFVKKIAKLLDQ